jgi:hypothetical protein
MPNATVRITPFSYNREYPFDVLTALARGEHVSTSDRSGNYEISGLTSELGQPPSKLFAFAGGLATGPQDAPTRTSTIDLVLKPTGTISGTIGHTLKAGETTPVVIAVSDADVDIQLVAVVEDDGTFGLHDVPIGDYRLELFGDTSQTKNVTVDQDKDTYVSF